MDDASVQNPEEMVRTFLVIFLTFKKKVSGGISAELHFSAVQQAICSLENATSYPAGLTVVVQCWISRQKKGYSNQLVRRS